MIPLSRTVAAAVVVSSCAVGAASATGADGLEHVVVTADFRERPVERVPSSVTLLDAATLEQAAVQHFEELIAKAPNLHWAGGSSRPRYLQIRGVGERQQYEGAPNPSVGFLVDNIDFSGVGMVATLFDVERIEVLRGPQGTRYGANALAGIVNVRTRGPGDTFDAHAEVTAGTDDALAAGFAAGGPVGEAGGLRVAAHRYRSNGFRDNATLGRDDTNGRDETTLRMRAALESDRVDLDATLLHADIDNGYDAFAIDNSLTTLSDKPGRDAQRSTGGALRIGWRAHPRFEIEALSSAASSDIVHSFDGDWGSDTSWGQFAPYDFTSDNRRDRRSVAQEFRLVSTPEGALFDGRADWVVGAWAQRLDENNDLLDLFNGEIFRTLVSDYRATSVAVFGELDAALGDAAAVGGGLRVERRSARYTDSAGAAFDPDETMLGGHLSVNVFPAPTRSYFVRLARGYKAGGFNIDLSVPPERREYDAETMTSLETGLRSRWLDDRLALDVVLFYAQRRDQQVRTSTQLDPGDPLSFIFLTGNAARGQNYGLEGRLDWRIDERWRLDATLGLLQTKFDDYDAVDPGALEGREQAHAPGYQYQVALSYRDARGFVARADLSGVDAFYFSDSHDQRSQAYTLLGGRVGYEGANWSMSLWARNLLDENYAVRGFFFGNEPPDFADKLYVQRGDPRQVGVTVRYRR